MKKEHADTISRAIGVQPILINSNLVSAQNRKRYFWCGKWNGVEYEQFYIPQPEDKKILLKDILEENIDDKYIIRNVDYIKVKSKGDIIGYIRSNSQGNRIYKPNKSVTLTASGGGRGAKTGLYKIGQQIRRLTPIECLRLQSMPDNYFEDVICNNRNLSDTQKYKMCGNAFTKEVMKHILKCIIDI